MIAPFCNRFVPMLLTILLASASFSSLAAQNYSSPRVGLVISRESFEHNWTATQMSAHGWTAIAHLAGIPYDTLFLDDLIQTSDLSDYSSIVFIRCTRIKDTAYPKLLDTIAYYLEQGGSIIVEGPLALFDQNEKPIAHGDLDTLIGLTSGEYFEGEGYRIKVTGNTHQITSGYEPGMFATQEIANGFDVLRPLTDDMTLLAATDGEQTYPYLSAYELGDSRIVLVSDFSASSGAASLFRNLEPRGFYANKIYSVLVDALYWSIYGELSHPFPALQFGNAQMAAILRLDADDSYDLPLQERTVNYLTQLARDTGAVSIYGWVTDGAAAAGWEFLAPLATELEDSGGQIATHSRTHFWSREITHQIAVDELGRSISEMEAALDANDARIGNVELFINPNTTIKMDSYQEISNRFSLYMTHGFGQIVPIGYGTSNWYMRPDSRLVFLESTPVSDWVWFYASGWSYSTSEIANFEEAIFDHMYTGVGRGVIFNQMWHDYGVNSKYEKKPFSLGNFFGPSPRITNDDNRPMFDGIKAKFATNEIYFPDAVDLRQKLGMMAEWSYSWSAMPGSIVLDLDLSSVSNRDYGEYTGGMGIRIERSHSHITGVRINGREHYAYDKDIVLLPNLEKSLNRIEIELGSNESDHTRLRYVSKRMTRIEKKEDRIEFDVMTKSKAKFSVVLKDRAVLLNANAQEWDRMDDGILTGFVDSDRTLVLQDIGSGPCMIRYASARVVGYSESDNTQDFALDLVPAARSRLVLRCVVEPMEIRTNGDEVPFGRMGRDYEVSLQELDGSTDLQIVFSQQTMEQGSKAGVVD